MTNAFAGIAQGLNEAVALNEGQDIAAKTHRPALALLHVAVKEPQAVLRTLE